MIAIEIIVFHFSRPYLQNPEIHGCERLTVEKIDVVCNDFDVILARNGIDRVGGASVDGSAHEVHIALDDGRKDGNALLRGVDLRLECEFAERHQCGRGQQLSVAKFAFRE